MIQSHTRPSRMRSGRWTCGCLTATLMLFCPLAVWADGYDPFEEEPPARVAREIRDDPFDAPATQPEEAVVPFSAQPGSSDAERSPDLAPSLSRDRASAEVSEEAPREETLPQPSSGCGTPGEKPLGALTIDIQKPAGELPNDEAAACWHELNATSGSHPAVRNWAVDCYFWNASCLFYQPLYFEEINLERYGYGHSDCFQSVVSAAHFFGTVPALPYCLTADPPWQCEYPLGHYRPGSCPPWQCHRPPLDPVAGLAEGGVLTGMIFLIP